MGDPDPVVVPWKEAQAVVRAEVERRRTDKPVLVVGITGGVGSGKSSLARRLSESIVSTDDYLPEYDQLPYQQWDHPDHADLELLQRHLAELGQGRPATVPVWSFHSHRREGYRVMEPPPPPSVVVCEGIHALNRKVRPRLDLAVFVEAPAHVRWLRCERREMTGERGWGVAAARKFFDEVAEPTYALWSEEYRRAADVVVINDETS